MLTICLPLLLLLLLLSHRPHANATVLSATWYQQQQQPQTAAAAATYAFGHPQQPQPQASSSSSYQPVSHYHFPQQTQPQAAAASGGGYYQHHQASVAAPSTKTHTNGSRTTNVYTSVYSNASPYNIIHSYHHATTNQTAANPSPNTNGAAGGRHAVGDAFIAAPSQPQSVAALLKSCYTHCPLYPSSWQTIAGGAKPAPSPASSSKAAPAPAASRRTQPQPPQTTHQQQQLLWGNNGHRGTSYPYQPPPPQPPQSSVFEIPGTNGRIQLIVQNLLSGGGQQQSHGKATTTRPPPQQSFTIPTATAAPHKPATQTSTPHRHRPPPHEEVDANGQPLPTPPPYIPPPLQPPQPPSPQQTSLPAASTTPNTEPQTASENPCPIGQPLTNNRNGAQTCNFIVRPNGGCPPGYWCHTGASYDTTVCCPRTFASVDRCQLPAIFGEGAESIPRWYFDQNAQKCRQFAYRGLRGNANNFITSMQCQDACESARPPKQIIMVGATAPIGDGGQSPPPSSGSSLLLPPSEQAAPPPVNPCANGPPARALNGELFACSGARHEQHEQQHCPAGHYCHVGESARTTACCPLTSSAADRCVLAAGAGEGSAQLHRFYYNTVARKCVPFTYRGLRGNENNFLAEADCTAQCVRPVNPCPMITRHGHGKTTNGGHGGGSTGGGWSTTLRQCSGPGGDPGQRCPSGEWCHIGATPDTTQCCPMAASDPCKLPLDVGQGDANQTRWFADPSEEGCGRECRPFAYRGIRGNQNNFLSREECEAMCRPGCANPCADGELLLEPSGRPRHCDPAHNKCPHGFWCHVGADPDTTACCSVSVKRACALPKLEGVGSAVLARWWYNEAAGGCERFLYRGTRGNQNNYVDQRDCLRSCYDATPPPTTEAATTPVDVHRPPFAPEPPAALFVTPTPPPPPSAPAAATTNGATSIVVAPVAERPPKKATTKNGGGGGADVADSAEGGGGGDEAELEALLHKNPCGSGHPLLVERQPKLCSPDGDPCEQPVSAGIGSASIVRFYFDATLKRCAEFMYRGARGNANNFLSVDDCELVCLVPSKNPCNYGTPLLDEANEPLVCGGETLCPAGYWCHVGSGPTTTNCCPDHQNTTNMCLLPVAFGNGDEHLDRWHFDAASRACRKFFYTGLRGNPNNFLSRTACRDACEATNPCLHGELLPDAHGQLLPCGADDQCAPNAYCHIGASAASTGCCAKTGVARCALALNRGGHAAEHAQPLKRWHFNAVERRCAPFVYAGLRGNENNFLTQHQCEEVCLGGSDGGGGGKEKTHGGSVKPLTPAFCPHGPPQIDPSHQPVRCSAEQACSDGYVCHMNDELDVSVCCENPEHFCLQARDAGRCAGDETRYGYNPLTDACVPYAYTGCGGTLNNFGTFERCTEICCRQYRRKTAMAMVHRDDPRTTNTTSMKTTIKRMGTPPNARRSGGGVF